MPKILPNIYRNKPSDRFCGLMVRVPNYTSTGPLFDSRRYQIFESGSGTGSTQTRKVNVELSE
jgi:hypothetical protein